MVDGVTTQLVATLVAFVIGSIPFGVLVGRRRGVDVRSEGSGNIGATNVARTAGKAAGVVVLLADVAKGAVPMAVYLHVLDGAADGWLIAIGLAPILGHCFSPWLKFRGGKGVATSLGVFIVLDPVAALVAFAVFAVIYAVARVVSIGSMVGALSILATAIAGGRPRALVILAGVVTALIIARHHANLRRLFGREELKL